MNQMVLSIVTPCLNAEQFIRETVNSVLSQDIPRLDYRVVDGGSCDRTLGILQAYADRLSLISEPDRGQADAINKGLSLASGEILSWINASDMYLPGAFAAVSRYFADHPEAGLVFGRAVYLSADGKILGPYETAPSEEMLALNSRPDGHLQRLLAVRSGWIPQQTAFWRRSVMERAGLLDPDLHYAMDYEYWLRLGRVAPIHFLDAPLGAFRLHPGAKSSHAWRQWREVLKVNRRHHGPIFSLIHRAFLQAAFRSIVKRTRRILYG